MPGVRLENFGGASTGAFDETVDYYGGRPHPDTWRAAARERIERIRKGDVTLRVLDAAGRPVPRAQVRVQQQRHGFRFGSEAPAARLVDTKDPDNLRFQREVLRQWWTRWHGTTGPDGTATLRAFYGRHRVTAEAGGKRAEAIVELSPGKATVAVLHVK